MWSSLREQHGVRLSLVVPALRRRLYFFKLVLLLKYLTERLLVSFLPFRLLVVRGGGARAIEVDLGVGLWEPAACIGRMRS